MRFVSPLFSAAARAARWRPKSAAKGCLSALLLIGLASNSWGIEWTTGAPGGSTPGGGLDFKGGNGPASFVDVQDLDMLVEFDNWASDYTMSLWISPDQIPGENFFLGQTNQGIHQGLRNGGKLHQAHWGADHSGDTTVPTGPASDPSSWTHALYTWDFANEEAQIYFNGVADTPAPVAKRAPNGDGNLIIGSRNGAGGPAFDGQIDDVAVWSGILSQDNITALAGGTSPSTFTDNMVGFWNFEEGTGLTANDSSPNNFHGSFLEEPPPPPPLFPAERLAGPAGTDGNWGTIDYFDIGETVTAPAETVVAQLLAIQDGDLQPNVVESGQFPALHHADPDNAGGQGGKLDNATIEPYPGEEPGVDDDDFIQVAHGRLNVQEAGEYTIAVESDDGFGLRIFGAEFTQVSGGELDAADPTNSTVLFRGNTGNSNTLALVNLQQGTYTAEYFMWERGGGAYNEVASASGNHMGGGRTQWLALGDGTILDERVEIPGEDDPPYALLTAEADIRVFDLAQEDQPIELAREVMLDEFDDPDAQDESPRVQMDDQNLNNAGCPFGVFNADGNQPQFPDGTRAYGSQNVDDFGSVMTGTFTVNDYDGTDGENLDMIFHVDSDDRSAFHIIGQSFEDVDDSGFFFDFDGDESIGDDSNTCNTNYNGQIQLTEGEEYSFQFFHTERGGDAGFQVLAGLGDDVFDVPIDDMRLMATGDPGEPIVFPRNVGIGLVMEDPNNTDPDIMGGLEGDYNGDSVLDAADIDLQSAEMKKDVADQNLALFDHNGDNVVNDSDRTIWVKQLRGTWVGDSTLDDEFNSGDLVAVFAAGKYETGEMAGWAEGDWDGNMLFDSGDLVASFSDGGFEQGPLAPAAVPEPSSLVLALLSVMGVIGIVRRRK